MEVLELDSLNNKGIEQTEQAVNLNNKLKTEMIKFHEDA